MAAATATGPKSICSTGTGSTSTQIDIPDDGLLAYVDQGRDALFPDDH